MGLLIQRIISPPPLPWLPLILLVMLTERKAFFVHYLLLFHTSVTLFFMLSVIRCTIVKMYYFSITKNFIYLFIFFSNTEFFRIKNTDKLTCLEVLTLVKANCLKDFLNRFYKNLKYTQIYIYILNAVK